MNKVKELLLKTRFWGAITILMIVICFTLWGAQRYYEDQITTQHQAAMSDTGWWIYPLPATRESWEVAENGQLWLSGPSYLSVVDMDTAESQLIYQATTPNTIRSIMPGAGHDIWFVTHNQLTSSQMQLHRLNVETQEDTLIYSSDGVTSFIELAGVDSQGRLWGIELGAGAFYVTSDELTFVQMDRDIEFPADLDLELGIHELLVTPTQVTLFWRYHQEQEDRSYLFVAQSNGDGWQTRLVRRPDNLGSSRFKLTVDNQGEVWLAPIIRAGSCCTIYQLYEDEAATEHLIDFPYSRNHRTGAPEIVDITFDTQNRLWLAFSRANGVNTGLAVKDQGGLHFIDTADVFDPLLGAPSRQGGGSSSRLHLDSNQDLWVQIGQRVVRMPIADSLPPADPFLVTPAVEAAIGWQAEVGSQILIGAGVVLIIVLLVTLFMAVRNSSAGQRWNEGLAGRAQAQRSAADGQADGESAADPDSLTIIDAFKIPPQWPPWRTVIRWMGLGVLGAVLIPVLIVAVIALFAGEFWRTGMALIWLVLGSPYVIGGGIFLGPLLFLCLRGVYRRRDITELVVSLLGLLICAAVLLVGGVLLFGLSSYTG